MTKMSEIIIQKARGFTVELESRADLKKVNLGDGSQGVLIQGTIGKIIDAKFEEEVVLEVKGENGTIRIDLKRKEIKPRKNQERQK